jgi:hypothetical protein
VRACRTTFYPSLHCSGSDRPVCCHCYLFVRSAIAVQIFVELEPGTCRNDGLGPLPDGRQFTRHTFQPVVVLDPVCAARHRDCGNRQFCVCGLANGCLDRVTQHNGNGLHHQRRTLWADTLLPHWPLFPGDGPCHIVLRDWRHTAREQWLESDRFDNPGRCRWLVLPAGVHLRKIPKGSCWLRITAQFCLDCTGPGPDVVASSQCQSPRDKAGQAWFNSHPPTEGGNVRRMPAEALMGEEALWSASAFAVRLCETLGSPCEPWTEAP